MKDRKEFWGPFCLGVIAAVVVSDWAKRGRELEALKTDNEPNKK